MVAVMAFNQYHELQCFFTPLSKTNVFHYKCRFKFLRMDSAHGLRKQLILYISYIETLLPIHLTIFQQIEKYILHKINKFCIENRKRHLFCNEKNSLKRHLI